MAELADVGISPRSMARILSGIRSFYRFLYVEKEIEQDPTELLESPKIGRRLPEVLTVAEIDAMIEGIDLSQPEGQRNRAILEMLYSCGMRASDFRFVFGRGLHQGEGQRGEGTFGSHFRPCRTRIGELVPLQESYPYQAWT